MLNFACAVQLDGAEVQGKSEQETWLGSRKLAPGVARILSGMRAGGYRRVRVPPHLAFGSGGIPARLHADSDLHYEVWLDAIHTTVAEV
jgi:FKBP-type peptidyl-prolyl cis-trans isomerase